MSLPPAPFQPAHSLRRRMVGPAATTLGLGVATIALHLRDPHDQGSWGLCPSAAMGWWCPGCGGLRAVNDLTHLRLVDAASSNLLLVVLVPVVVVLIGRWALAAWRGTERQLLEVTTPVLVVILSAILTFTVLRNLTGFGWLAP